MRKYFNIPGKDVNIKGTAFKITGKDLNLTRKDFKIPGKDLNITGTFFLNNRKRSQYNEKSSQYKENVSHDEKTSHYSEFLDFLFIFPLWWHCHKYPCLRQFPSLVQIK